MAFWKRRERNEEELDEEVRGHLERAAAEGRGRGLGEREAQTAARKEFGNVELVKETAREMRPGRWLEDLAQDVRYGWRMLRKNPGFTAIAMLTLALGIGANTAIFSVVNAVLLRPLAYRDSDRLVTILHERNDPVSIANYIDWKEQSHSFEEMAAAEYWTATLTGRDAPERLVGLRLTQNMLPMLGVEPVIGRVFEPGEDQVGRDHEVVLSYGLWQRLFSGDGRILGQDIRFNGEPYTVIGVMPAEFKFAPFWATHAEFWTPEAFGQRIHNRGGNSLRVFARLKPGVEISEARAEMATITARLEKEFPGTNRRVQVTSLKEQVVGAVQAPLLVLLAAAGFVLLIACANVAHMLLARTTARQREIAVRTALGAGRRRVIRQFLTESLLLAGIGGGLGLLLAWWGTRLLVAFGPRNIPRVETITVDLRAIVFLAGVAFLSSVIAGIMPAARAAEVNLSDALKEGGRAGSESHRRNQLRRLLVASEIALAVALLAGAGLMVRSFRALQSVDSGFDPHNVMSMVVSIAGTKEAEPGQRANFYPELLERLRSLPGIVSVGAINHLPLTGDMWGLEFAIEGRPKPLPGEAPGAVYRIVMPGYFETMRLPILRGRGITAADDMRSPGVVVINERAAKMFWPGEDPLGKRIRYENKSDGEPNWLTVVGIAKDAKQEDWAAQPYPETYRAALQTRDFLESPIRYDYISVVARIEGEASTAAAGMKETVWSMDRNLAISQVQTMDKAVEEANAQPRFEMTLLGVFAAVAVILAAAGIFGLMSYSVSQRTHEIGIRMSLGASRMEVMRLVMGQGMQLAAAGAVGGIAAALALTRLMTKMLYGVKPGDPLTFAGVAATLGAVAAIACWIPARRATRVDPMAALRHD